ncbi:MAG TPA: hypothetical protein VMR59_01625 [Patescibacteria group bacterium]|jgi:hypothetical protein|nr:hypothetical protein [Patescibacteria group bacterium]
MSETEEQQIFLKPIETFHCAPDDSSYKGERIDRYFREVIDLVGYNDRAKAAFCRIVINTLGFEDGPKLDPTNNFTHILTVQHRQVAFALETRDEFNFIDMVMVCTITPELLAQLRRLEYLK